MFEHKLLHEILKRVVCIDQKVDALLAETLPDTKIAELTAKLKTSQQELQASLDAVPPAASVPK